MGDIPLNPPSKGDLIRRSIKESSFAESPFKGDFIGSSMKESSFDQRGT